MKQKMTIVCGPHGTNFKKPVHIYYKSGIYLHESEIKVERSETTMLQESEWVAAQNG